MENDEGRFTTRPRPNCSTRSRTMFSNNDVTITKVQGDDIETLREMNRKDDPQSRWATENWLQDFHNKPDRFYMCCAKKPSGEIMGMGCIARLSPDYIFLKGPEGDYRITNVLVDPNHLGKGIATKMVSHLINEASKRGSKTVNLQVDGENNSAIKVYHSLGFKDAVDPWGQLPRTTGWRYMEAPVQEKQNSFVEQQEEIYDQPSGYGSNTGPHHSIARE